MESQVRVHVSFTFAFDSLYLISHRVVVLLRCTEVGKYIQSMARKGDEELLAAFAASCEGSSYHQETFDEDFFVSNATAIAEEHLKRETK